ncbi:MAG: ribose 5-phosphate isomerase B [Firmicutes bacterium]|nr:ribose 5-phosphate isomerase B [Bacillota bacterium]
MTIVIGSDHAAIKLKAELIAHLSSLGHKLIDVGSDGRTSDYPDFAHKVCHTVLQKQANCGILVCGTGIGMTIAANRYRGIRCALCTDEFSARMSRYHNNANVLALGCRVTGSGLALSIAEVFLTTDFSKEERHARRLAKIDNAGQ